MFVCRGNLVKSVLRSYSSVTQSVHGLEEKVPSRAQVVVCGGGIVGSSVVYHLPKFGFKDVVHLEQGSLGCGTTWHSAGLLGAIGGSRAYTKLTKYSNELYSHLEDSGLGTGIKKTGHLNLATTSGRLSALRRQQAVGRSLGLASEIISAAECAKICPLLRTDDVVGALYVCDNALSAGDPSDICRSLSLEARSQGVKLYEGVKVEGVETKDGKVAAVITSRGKIECEVFVNCAGQWARQLGKLSDPEVNIPLHSTEHFYIVTKPFSDVDLAMPTVRDNDNQLYIRQWSGGILAGCFELNGKPCFQDGVPDSFQFQLLPEDWEHCQPLLESIMHRIPSMENAEIRQMINGPESFTPDSHALMGEVPEIRNYYVGAGMCSTGIATAGGFGRALAEWISLGEPPLDLWEFDIARFSPYQANMSYLSDRARETLAHLYIVPWPHFERSSGRGIKTTPFHTQLDNAGASWGSISGWERPNWFAGPDGCRENALSFGKPNYFECVQQEHLACRENVALFDLSPFVKIEIEGEDAVGAMQRVCANNVDVPVSQVVYTGMLNHQGGYQTDCTVTRLAKSKFLAVCPSAQASHISTWLRRNVPTSVTVHDVTSQYCVLGLMGPKARQLLQPLTRPSLENTQFPFGTSQTLEIGFASQIRAMRISYVGELGWELHIPTEFALHVYDKLMEEGKKFGLKLAGAYAMDSLRLEKGYRHWGHELDSETSPVEARLMHAVDLNKGDFIGREAVLRSKSEGVRQLLGTFLVDIPAEVDTFPWGKELIYRDGVQAGYITSAGYGYSVGGHVCMGYVQCDQGNINVEYLRKGQYEVEVEGKKWPAAITTKSFYDSNSVNMKS